MIEENLIQKSFWNFNWVTS